MRCQVTSDRMAPLSHGSVPLSPMPTHSEPVEGVQQAFAKDILQGLNNKKFLFIIADPNQEDCPITFVSEAFSSFTGYNQDDFVGQNIRMLYGSETDAQGVAEMESRLGAGEEHRCTLACYRKDGSKFYNQMHCCPSLGADGKVSFVVGVFQEVDEEGKPIEETMPSRAKEVAASLSGPENEELPELDYAGVLGNLQLEQVVCVSNPKLPDCPIIYVNQKFYDLTQREPSEVIGLNCRFLQGPETDPEDVTEIREAVKAGRPVTTCLLNYKKDGTPFWNHLHIEPVYDRKGELTYYVASQYDVTTLMDEAIQLVSKGQPLEGKSSALGKSIQKVFGESTAFEESQDSTLLSVCLNLGSDTKRVMHQGRRRPLAPRGTLEAAN